MSVQQLQKTTGNFAQLRTDAWQGIYLHFNVILAPEALGTAVASRTK